MSYAYLEAVMMDFLSPTPPPKLSDDDLHRVARAVAAQLRDPDRKQLRFNDIVRVARSHYPLAPAAGVAELVRACDRADADYVAGQPMWAHLEHNAGWLSAQNA